MSRPKESVLSRCTVVALSVIIIAAVVTGVIAVSSLLKKFAYRDLGIEYDKNDVASVDEKMELEFDKGENGKDGGDVIDELQKQGKKLGVDYTIEYSDYQYKTMYLTSNEATALINERMPSLAFLTDAQIKIGEKKLVEFTSGCDLRSALDYLYPNTEINVPNSVSEMTNIYLKAVPVVKDDILYASELEMESGILEFVDVDIKSEMSVDISNMLKNAPELKLSDMHITDDGLMSLTGYLPTRAKVIEY